MKSTKQVRELLKHVHEQALQRQEQNRTHMASMRSETFPTNSTEHNRTHMASMRASETFQQTLHRQQQDRVHKASH